MKIKYKIVKRAFKVGDKYFYNEEKVIIVSLSGMPEYDKYSFADPTSGCIVKYKSNGHSHWARFSNLK